MACIQNTKGNESPTNGGKHIRPNVVFWIAIIVVIVVCVGYPLLMCYIFPSDIEKRGQFGDMFGFIGALFSGLAFAGLIVTMLQQREDLQNQKDEIALQRKDLEAQTEALRLQKKEIAQTNQELKEQNKTIMLQRFESTYFNMLDYLRTIYENVVYKGLGNDYKGQSAFNCIEEICGEMLRNGDNYDKSIQIRYMCHYYRYFTQIIKFIDGAQSLSLLEKRYYVELLCSHLSFIEMELYMFYCLSSYGKEEAKPLAEKYALFLELHRYKGYDGHLSGFSEGAYKI